MFKQQNMYSLPPVIYLYDLPKNVTSSSITEAVKNIADYKFPLGDYPWVIRDPKKNFYSALI